MRKSCIKYRLIQALLALLLTGCQPHDPFCFQHPHGARVRVNVDWSQFNEADPTGMTLTLFPTDETQSPTKETTHTITHAVFNLLPDKYTAFVFNQSESEFGSVSFHNMDHYSTAEIRTIETTSNWYKPANDEKLGRSPEWLAFNHKDATVTPEMTDGGYGYEDGPHTRTDGVKETLITTLVPQNIVYTLHVSLKINGIDNFKAARAVITDMADGYFPGLQRYHTKKVSHLMETWTVKDITAGSNGEKAGVIYGEITCFGLPEGHNWQPEENALKISLLLVDNKTILNRLFNVGNRIYQHTTNGSPLHLYIDLTLSDSLPDVTPALGDNESGFDAIVNGWGDDIEVDIGM